MQFKDHIVHVVRLKHLRDGFRSWFSKDVMVPISSNHDLVSQVQAVLEVQLEVFQPGLAGFAVVVGFIESFEMLFVHREALGLRTTSQMIQ